MKSNYQKNIKNLNDTLKLFGRKLKELEIFQKYSEYLTPNSSSLFERSSPNRNSLSFLSNRNQYNRDYTPNSFEPRPRDLEFGSKFFAIYKY